MIVKNTQVKKLKLAGFTLLELMVSMVIFSFMSIMAYSALAGVFNSNEVITAQEKKLKQLQRCMLFIERDLRQIVLRPKSSGYGQPPIPALISGLDSEGVIEFTRAGNSNPTALVRSSLQRIRYVLEENTLGRKSWNIVDHIDAKPVEMMLLEHVESLAFKFLDDKNNWHENWSSLTTTPKAIELTMEHKNWGKIVRLFSMR